MKKLDCCSVEWIKSLAPILLICVTPAIAADLGGRSQIDARQKGATEWVKLTPEGAPFSVWLPASPVEKAKDEEAGLRVHYYKLKVGPTEYQVVWFANIPYGLMRRDALSILFQRGLADMLKSARRAGGKELVTTHQDAIALNGYSGRVSTMESATDQIDAKCFLARYDSITLAVFHSKQEAASADAKRFFDSLSLTNVRTANSTQGGPASGAENTPGTDVDTRPIPLNRVRPKYTELARKHGVQGIIRVRALIGMDGSVRDVRLLSHLLGGLDTEATKAVRRMRFKPATKAGQPVDFWQTLEVEFNLR